MVILPARYSVEPIRRVGFWHVCRVLPLKPATFLQKVEQNIAFVGQDSSRTNLSHHGTCGRTVRDLI